MSDIVTLGEAMIVFDPMQTGPLKFTHGYERKVGGAELNFAIGCTRLGLSSSWISALGNDPFGKYIRDFARGEGIDVSQVKFVDHYPTSLNFKEISEVGNVNTYYYRDKSPTLQMSTEDIEESYIAKAKIFHITGVFPAINPKKNMPLIRHAIQLAQKNNLKISYDPNIRLKMITKEEAREMALEIMPFVDILLAGEEELAIIFETSDHQKMYENAKALGVETIVIKCGEKGAISFNNNQVIHYPAETARKVVDTVGAGDGFNAGFIYGYLNNWELEKTMRFANTIGAMVVEVKGDNEGLPYLEDVHIRLGYEELIER